MNSIQFVTAERPLHHEMRQKAQLHDQFFTFKDLTPTHRPTSVATEFVDTDWDEEDEEIVSEIEDEAENSPRLSLNSTGQRSLTTLSSYDEVQTPRSSRTRVAFPFEVDPLKQVEGPRGPHLFRSSTTSSDSTEYQNTLTLSPLTPKAPPRAAQADYLFNFDNALAEPVPPMPGSFRRQSDEPFQFTDERLDTAELSLWTPEMVAQWMLNAGVELSVADKFVENDINGGILITLKFEDLRELNIQSFGVRTKVWEEIHVLRGSRPSSPQPPTPIEDVPSKEVKKQGRKPSTRKKHPRPAHDDIITPLESVSIVGIEQMMPKPHHCSKGENCSKWRRNQRMIEAFKRDHPFVNMDEGGIIMVAGDPGNPTTATSLQPNASAEHLRPVSDAVPSVVASSDVLGPGTEPRLQHLQEEALAAIQTRDPQDNVRQFLDFQAAHVGSSEVPPTPPFEIFPAQRQPHEGLRSLPRLSIPGRQSPLRQSAASIARAASAQPQLSQQNNNTFVPYRMSRADPLSPDLATPVAPYRFGTPFSEMDVPVTAIPLGPVARDASQSVPPDMNFRPQINRSMSRSSKRPSVSVMPAVDENKAANIPPARSTPKPPSPARGLPPSPKAWKLEQQAQAQQMLKENTVEVKKASKDPKKPAPLTAPPRQPFPFSKSTGGVQPVSAPHSVTKFPPGVTHAGPMRKRKTKMLRHEWNEHYFTLKGTRLAMHEDADSADKALEYVDIDDYAIACSSLVSTSKLNSAFKAMNISRGKKNDVGGFSFQLIPQDSKGGFKVLRKRDSVVSGGSGGTGRRGSLEENSPEGVNGTGKTHHFAVKSRDERIDWMRELMLAKALKQKGEGFEVSVNGNMI